MATIFVESLRGRFAALQAERERSWSSEQLAANVAQRRRQVASFDARRIAQVGDRLPSINLANVEGGSLTIGDVTANGAAVVLFFRFADCPTCNVALSYYNEMLHPALHERGISLLALSPQRPDLLGAIKLRNSLDFIVATDPGNALSRYLGISFVPDEAFPPHCEELIGDLSGMGVWERPWPTALILDRHQKIRWLRVSPDWLDRPEAEEILAALDAL